MKYNEIMKAIPHDTKVKDLPPVMACFNKDTYELVCIEMCKEWENGKYLNVVFHTNGRGSFGTFLLDGEGCYLYNKSIYVNAKEYNIDFTKFTCDLNA